MPRFPATVVAIVLLNYLAIIQEYSGNQNSDVVYLFEMFVLGGTFSLAAIFLGVIPYGTSFCVDWKNQFIRGNVIRTARNAYAWSKVVSVAVSAFAAVFAGYILTVLLFATHMPLVGNQLAEYGYQIYNDTVFGQLLLIHPLVFLLVRICIVSASCMFWSVYALMVSAYSANIFVAFSAPVITYYVAINSVGRGFPNYLRLNALFSGRVDMGGAALSLAYAVTVFMVLSLLIGLVFSRKVKRRLSNG